MPGYDSAQRVQENDDLGRWRFAAEIAEVIRSTPPDWSARIGIFGKWGEGKSTVLHFLEEMLKPEGNIIFYFTPWAVKGLDELWEEFGRAFLDTLESADLEVESPWKGLTRKVQEKLESTPLPGLAQGTAELFGKDKAFTSAVGLLGKWLKPDGAQVKKIRERLGEKKRVIAFIDDLDRASPELLPKLLLSLREILDLPGFTFVLAFDNEIVADGLLTANKAWGDGDSFLDKILDFHYYLPPVTKVGKRLLLRKMLDRYADFVPQESVDPIEHLLPDNPRKLKRLVRGLVSLRPQLARHGADELNWIEIWLAEMIRQESYPFFVRLLDGGLSSLMGTGYAVRRTQRKMKGEDNDSNDNADIKKVIDETGGMSASQTERLTELVMATRSLAGFNLEYNFKFALQPEAVTSKEFYEFLAQCKEAPAAETISTWIEKQSITNSIGSSDIETELFDTLINARQNTLAQAAEASTIEENTRLCAKAKILTTVTERFLNLPQLFTPERFGKVYGSSLYWIAFRANPADAALREHERSLIYSLISRVSEDQAPAVLEEIKPWDGWAFPDAGTRELQRELKDECVRRLLPTVEDAFATYIARPESIRLLCTSTGSPSYRYILFNPDYLPWGTAVRSSMLEIMQNAKEDIGANQKANEFLEILVNAAINHSSYISRNSAESIIQDREFTAALWRGATSRPVQFRMLHSYLEKRKVLLELGANAEDLALSPELAEAEGMATEASPTESEEA